MVPARTCGRELAAVSIMKSIWPATENPASLGRGRRDRRENLKRVPVTFWKKSPPTVDMPPAPVVPWVAMSGLAFSHAINSFKFSAGKAFFATMRSGSLETSETGSKSLMRSYLSANVRAVQDMGSPVAENERVAVCRCSGHTPDADGARGANHIFDNDGLAEGASHALSHDAPDRIRWSARTEWYDHRYWARRIECADAFLIDAKLRATAKPKKCFVMFLRPSLIGALREPANIRTDDE